MRPSKLAPGLVLAGFTVFGVACSEDWREWPQEAFTAETWKERAWQERYRLYRSLEESQLLEGASRERVTELLGPPNGGRKPDRMSYLIRQEYRLGFIGEVTVLEIQFDAEGRVETYLIRGT